MRAIEAAIEARPLVQRCDFASANRILLRFSSDLCSVGESFDRVDSITTEPPPFVGYPQFDAGLAAFAEIHRQLLGLPELDWTRDPHRYIELSSLYPDRDTHEDPAGYFGLVHPTLLMHGVVLPGASLHSWSTVTPGNRADSERS